MTNILVIDSNIAFSTLLTEELDRQNYDVEAAFDFDEALAFARAQSFELALVDMGVNEPGGLELAQRLREEQPELRLMLIPLLGEELPDEVRQALPIQGVLPKPFFLPELPERIEKALQASLDAEPGVAEPESPVISRTGSGRGRRGLACCGSSRVGGKHGANLGADSESASRRN